MKLGIVNIFCQYSARVLGVFSIVLHLLSLICDSGSDPFVTTFGHQTMKNMKDMFDVDYTCPQLVYRLFHVTQFVSCHAAALMLHSALF